MSAPAADRLRALVAAHHARLERLDEGRASAAPAPGKWSPKEVIGHLIDSAAVNLERFLRARDTDHLDFPGYPQDAWVAAQGYQDVPWHELLGLWRALNLHVARLVERTPEETLELARARHALDRIAFRAVPRDEPATLAYLVDDYVAHLRHHLESIAG